MALPLVLLASCSSTPDGSSALSVPGHPECDKTAVQKDMALLLAGEGEFADGMLVTPEEAESGGASADEVAGVTKMWEELPDHVRTVQICVSLL